MAGQLSNLPCAQIGEDGFRQLAALRLQAVDFLTDIDLGVAVHMTQLLDLCLEIGNRLFEFEKVEIHGVEWRLAPAKLSG